MSIGAISAISAISGMDRIAAISALGAQDIERFGGIGGASQGRSSGPSFTDVANIMARRMGAVAGNPQADGNKAGGSQMSISSGISNATALDGGGKGALATQSMAGMSGGASSGAGASVDAVRSDFGMSASRMSAFEGLRSEKTAGSSSSALAGGAARARDERF